MIDFVQGQLTGLGLTEKVVVYGAWLVLGLAVLVLALLANYLTRRILLAGVTFFIKRTRTKWDDALLKNKVFSRLAYLAPAMVVYFSAPLFGLAGDVLLRLSLVYMIVGGLWVFNSFLNATVDIYNTFEIARQRPIKGYVQLVKIVLSVFIGIIALATLMDKSPWLLLSGLGAMTAVLLLVFKDTILGLVASIQLSTDDMVRIGDWIEMPKYGVDGDVIDITLHTVVVQNWDKTVVTIPAYGLISGSFKNWRGMTESGGRRIKRAISIDLGSIKLCTPLMLDRFEKYQLISEYVRSKRQEVEVYNREHNIDQSELVNGRNLTNIGTFRAYMVAYLRNHPKIHQGMTFLVRQLPPSEKGLPIELYVFSNVQEWAAYEDITADIFDHLLAVVSLFDLRLFQNPTGFDFRAIGSAAAFQGSNSR